MIDIYPPNNPGGVHLTAFNFVHLSPPPIINLYVLLDNISESMNFWSSLPTLKSKKCSVISDLIRGIGAQSVKQRVEELTRAEGQEWEGQRMAGPLMFHHNM